MKTAMVMAFLVVPLLSTASVSGTPPIKTEMSQQDVLTACESYGSQVVMIPNGCLNPRTGSMLVCDLHSCKKYAPDPRYIRLRVLMPTERNAIERR